MPATAAPRVAGARKLEKIGLQLYTLRGEMRRDLPGTLAAVAAIGYREVEFAGYFDRTPAQIRELLQRNQLTSPSTHLGIDVIEKDVRKTADDARVIGHEWLTVPSLPRGQRATVDDWKTIAEQFNRVGAQVKAAGLKLAFHNHDAELRKVGDVTGLDVLIRETDPALVAFEMDIYWVVKGGGDPLDFIARYPGRFRMVHVKDAGPAPDRAMTEVGGGTIDFARIFAQRGRAGIQHYFVEHDNPADPMASARASFAHLRRLEF